MGLIGLLVSVVMAVLGAGYYYFAMVPATPLVFTQDTNILKEESSGVLSQANTLIDKAKDVKDSVENKSEEQTKLVEEVEETEASATVETPREQGTLEIVNRLMTTGFAVPGKQRTIDTLVLHSSYNPNGGGEYDVEKIVKIYESYGVGAHYLIDRKGTIYRLIKDQNIAYHAGVSKMPDGRRDVNDFSIGIEIINKEDTEYTKVQYEAVNDLVAYLKRQYRIKNVVGHEDIAPGRKTDPWNFDWKKLK